MKHIYLKAEQIKIGAFEHLDAFTEMRHIAGCGEWSKRPKSAPLLELVGHALAAAVHSVARRLRQWGVAFAARDHTGHSAREFEGYDLDLAAGR